MLYLNNVPVVFKEFPNSYIYISNEEELSYAVDRKVNYIKFQYTSNEDFLKLIFYMVYPLLLFLPPNPQEHYQ